MHAGASDNRSATNEEQEATEDSGTLTVDDDTEVFAALISYCYHFTYDDSARGEHTSVQTHTVHVYALADKYDTPQLQQLAAQKFKKVCNPVTDIDDFIAALCAVESSTNPADTTLWSIITPCIKTNVTMVLQSEEFKAVVDSMPSLKWSLMAMLDPAPKHEDPHKPNLPAIKRFDDHDEVDSEDNQPRRRGHWRSGGHRLG